MTQLCLTSLNCMCRGRISKKRRILRGKMAGIRDVNTRLKATEGWGDVACNIM